MTAKEFKRIRKSLGLKQRHIADLFNYSIWTVRSWEQEKKDRIVPEIVAYVMKNLPIDITALYLSNPKKARKEVRNIFAEYYTYV